MEEIQYPVRINKYLALKNYSTRRGADDLVAQKKVFINGRLAVLGDKVNEEDKVEVRGIQKKQDFMYFAFNKPKGIVSHSGTEDVEDIADIFPIQGVFPVGRLDKDSHGLIILTNDGRITDRLLSPKYEHDKEYNVTTKEKLRSSFKQKMESGVKMEGDDEITKPCKVEILDDNKFKITLTEGKKHQIRRMCSALFQEVADLKRVRIMNIKLGPLKQNQHRKIEGDELKKFLKSLSLI